MRYEVKIECNGKEYTKMSFVDSWATCVILRDLIEIANDYSNDTGEPAIVFVTDKEQKRTELFVCDDGKYYLNGTEVKNIVIQDIVF